MSLQGHDILLKVVVAAFVCICVSESGTSYEKENTLSSVMNGHHFPLASPWPQGIQSVNFHSSWFSSPLSSSHVWWNV